MTPATQIVKPLPAEDLRLRLTIARAHSLFLAYRDHGGLFQAAWAPTTAGRIFFRVIAANQLPTAWLAHIDEWMLIGTYNADTGWPQFQEDLIEAIGECGA